MALSELVNTFARQWTANRPTAVARTTYVVRRPCRESRAVSPARSTAVYRHAKPTNASLPDNTVVVGAAEQWAKIDG